MPAEFLTMASAVGRGSTIFDDFNALYRDCGHEVVDVRRRVASRVVPRRYVSFAVDQG